MLVLTCDLATSLLLGVQYPSAVVVPRAPFILVRPDDGRMIGIWELDPDLAREAGPWPIRGGDRSSSS